MHCLLLLSSCRVQRKFRYSSVPHHRRCATRNVERCQGQASFEWKGTGRQMVATINGFRDDGIVHRTKEPPGVIRTMFTSKKAGSYTRDTGTTKTTAARMVITTATMAITMITTITNH